MVSPMLELDRDELWTALEQLNPVDLLVDELIRRADRVDWSPHRIGRFVATQDSQGTELALLEDVSTGGRCLLPAGALRAARTATLSALAARQLLAPTVVTASVLGTSPAAQLVLGVLIRHVPDVGHIAVCPVPGARAQPLASRVVDQVDLAGIGLTVTGPTREAVFGANLVVVTDAGAWPLGIGQLPRGAVVINATGRDLPDDLVNDVDQLFVDDTGLLDENRHRYFVRAHLNGPSAQARPGVGRRRPRIEAPLGQVLKGGHPGRTRLDDTLLVELLSTQAMDAPLASELHRVALERGLGVRRFD